MRGCSPQLLDYSGPLLATGPPSATRLQWANPLSPYHKSWRARDHLNHFIYGFPFPHRSSFYSDRHILYHILEYLDDEKVG